MPLCSCDGQGNKLEENFRVWFFNAVICSYDVGIKCYTGSSRKRVLTPVTFLLFEIESRLMDKVG